MGHHGPQGREPTILFPMATTTKPQALKPQTKTEIIKRFIFDAGSSIVSVEFVKANGEKRQLCFNPRDTREIKGTGHALKSPSIIRCRDFAIARKEGQGAWRSFDCERVVSIKANGIVLYLF